MMACSRSCSRILGVSLGLSAQLAAGANLALFFPDWEVTSLKNGLIGKHALRGSGLWGGGLMVLLASILISLIGWRRGCFRNSGPCKSMLVSMLASCLAFLGAFVCFITSGAALKNGPFCRFGVSSSNKTQASKYGYPFKDLNDRNYLYDHFLWDSVCIEPSRAVIWHVTFFSTLLGVSVLQIILVLVQLINSFLGLFCGFFEKREIQKALIQWGLLEEYPGDFQTLVLKNGVWNTHPFITYGKVGRAF
ncbi:transmembrane 4 L6 family member 19 [Gracilinanus agilis]|uniref:transmembrane 4 L6 family member 19 n=1 Tax=Gracilinanus agilis TaxID=191870 RepID=UPI001CFC8CA1|nr:transmembrane 4 L6 family member 19 [Gracilinanus agilis]